MTTQVVTPAAVNVICSRAQKKQVGGGGGGELLLVQAAFKMKSTEVTGQEMRSGVELLGGPFFFQISDMTRRQAVTQHARRGMAQTPVLIVIASTVLAVI